MRPAVRRGSTGLRRSVVRGAPARLVPERAPGALARGGTSGRWDPVVSSASSSGGVASNKEGSSTVSHLGHTAASSATIERQVGHFIGATV